MTDFPTPADPRPTLPIWQARSFWVQIAALVSAGLALAGEAALGQEIADTLPDAVLTAITGVLGLWAYVERLVGRMRLTW